MPTGKEQVGEHFFGEGEGAFGEDEHEKVPWDGGRVHLEPLVVNATPRGAAPAEALGLHRTPSLQWEQP